VNSSVNSGELASMITSSMETCTTLFRRMMKSQRCVQQLRPSRNLNSSSDLPLQSAISLPVCQVFQEFAYTITSSLNNSFGWYLCRVIAIHFHTNFHSSFSYVLKSSHILFSPCLFTIIQKELSTLLSRGHFAFLCLFDC